MAGEGSEVSVYVQMGGFRGHAWGRWPGIYVHILCVYSMRTVYMSSIPSSTHLCEEPSGCLCVQAICISVL